MEVHVDLSVQLQERLINGDIDIGFYVGNAPGPDFSAVSLGKVENRWMCQQPIDTNPDTSSIDDVSSRAIATHSRGSHLHRTVMEWLAASGSKQPRIHCFNNLAMLIEMIASGLAIGILPRQLALQSDHAHRLRIIDAIKNVPSTEFSCIFSDYIGTPIIRQTAEMAVAEAKSDASFTSEQD